MFSQRSQPVASSHAQELSLFTVPWKTKTVLIESLELLVKTRQHFLSHFFSVTTLRAPNSSPELQFNRFFFFAFSVPLDYLFNFNNLVRERARKMFASALITSI